MGQFSTNNLRSYHQNCRINDVCLTSPDYLSTTQRSFSSVDQYLVFYSSPAPLELVTCQNIRQPFKQTHKHQPDRLRNEVTNALWSSRLEHVAKRGHSKKVEITCHVSMSLPENPRNVTCMNLEQQ